MHRGKSFKTATSIGLVCINATAVNLHSLLSAADAACYMAKEKGRNRVWLHQPDDVELQHGAARCR